MPKKTKTTRCTKKSAAGPMSLRGLVAPFDLDDLDAVELERLVVQARSEGAARRFGANPLKSEEFADDVALDCEHFEALFILPKNSVRKLYVRCYADGRREAEENAPKHLFVDPVNGNDENDGRSTRTALQTTTEAERRFKEFGVSDVRYAT